MKNFHPFLEHCVTRLEVTFKDDLGNHCTILATGFWLRVSAQEYLFVTNRHNLDPSLKNPNNKKKVSKIKIQIRQKKITDEYTNNTIFFEIKLNEIDGRLHRKADVAVLIFKRIPNGVIYSDIQDGNYSFESLPIEELADLEYLKDCCEIFDMVGFIGFPQKWYDTIRNAPVGRTAWLASNPSMPFFNEYVKTVDITLVTGLSFGGSSGSPVFSLPKGLKINSGQGIKFASSYAPPRLMGIMSGHFVESQNKGKEYPPHSGLSYFTRSLAIRELLEKPSYDELDYWKDH
jgi:hypothetical protein